MPREFKRTDRVAGQIQRELATIFQREVKDPRVGLVTVSAVTISSDLKHAKVFVTFLGKDNIEECSENLKVLRNISGYVRSLLAKSIRMRAIPELHFCFDASILRGQEMSSLIDSAIEQDEAKRNSEPSK